MITKEQEKSAEPDPPSSPKWLKKAGNAALLDDMSDAATTEKHKAISD